MLTIRDRLFSAEYIRRLQTAPVETQGSNVNQRKALDILVRNSLRNWPQCPPRLQIRRGEDTWLRGRPAEDLGTCHPFLKLPGSNKLRTLPDGLWLHFGGTAEDPFVDIFAIEACSSLQNLLDNARGSRRACNRCSLSVRFRGCSPRCNQGIRRRGGRRRE
jgi:hypothetical protein